MKVALVQPRGNILDKEPLPTTFSTPRTVEPLQLGYIAAVAQAAGHDARVINQWLQTDESLLEEIARSHPDVVGFSVMNFHINKALKLARLVKGRTGAQIVLGGPATAANFFELAQEEHVDFVIRGEGEYSFTSLLNALERRVDYQSIPGLVYKGKDSFWPPQRITDLDALPFPDRSSLDLSIMKEYLPSNVAFNWQIFSTIIGSRGCYHACRMCESNDIWGRKRISRSPENIVSEIKYLKENYGTNLIWFWDANPSRKDMLGLSEELLRQNVSATWRAFQNPAEADLGLYELMHDAGCEFAHFGAESGNDLYLKSLNKATTTQVTEKAVALAHEAGLIAHCTLMVGFPDQSMSEFLDEFAWFKALGTDSGVFFILTPLKGTPFYEECKQAGIIKNHNPDFYDLSHSVIETKLEKEWNKGDYKDILQWCWQNFYDKEWLKRAWSSPHRHALLNFSEVVRNRYNLDFGGFK